MTLTEYLRVHADRLIHEWVMQSTPLSVVAGQYSEAALSDRLRELLEHVAEGIEDLPSRDADAEVQNPADFAAWGRQHAEERLRQGYSLDDVVAEFCGLRDLVLQSWSKLPRPDAEAACKDLLRFNRVFDMGLMESIKRYSIDQTHARDLFTGMLVHDLRNPLGSIASLAQVLAVAPDSLGGTTEVAERMRRASDRMSQIIEEMLDVLQARLGRPLPLERESVSLHAICQQVVEEVRHQYPDCIVEIAADGDMAGKWDPARLARVVSNLLGNAAKYRAPGTAVLIILRGERDRVEFSVSNQGGAIASEDLVSMFEPMVRLRQHAGERSPTTRGLGLGLYVARQLVLAHGGSIHAASREGWNVFTVVLPRLP